jgi:inosine-uridine nucleoside N-ribohydrolase
VRERRVLIDTDPGLDDLLALALACGSPELRVAALTTVAGNAPLDAVSENAARFCELAELDVPLGRGAKAPLALAPVDAIWFHGCDGRSGLDLPAAPPRPAVAAAELLRECLVGRSVDCVIALGPLTNLGPLAAEHPDWFRGIPVFWMGGSLSGGNATPDAEFNCWSDPHAAALVLGAGIDLTVIGLDVTSAVALDAAGLGPEPFGSGPRARFLDALLGRLADAQVIGSGERLALLHDPTAVAAVTSPELFRWEQRRLEVSVGEGKGRGRMLDSSGSSGAFVRWAAAVDRDALIARVVSRLSDWARAAGDGA